MKLNENKNTEQNTNKYNIYMSQNEAKQLVLNLPVNPENIEINFDVDNKKYNVLSVGDVVRAGDRGLKTFKIKSYFPLKDSPDISVAIIEKMIKNKLPIRFIINRMIVNKLLFDLNIQVLIESFSTEEKGGEIGDIYYELKFTEYRENKAVIVNV